MPRALAYHRAEPPAGEAFGDGSVGVSGVAGAGGHTDACIPAGSPAGRLVGGWGGGGCRLPQCARCGGAGCGDGGRETVAFLVAAPGQAFV